MSQDLVAPQTQTQLTMPALQLFLDDKLFERAKTVASYLAKAEGFTPPHLVGKTEACFFVVTRAIGWRLDPFAVACSTFQIKGKVGFEGKLCQAIIENSGQVEGGVKYRTHGDWSKVQGKFKTIKSEKGNYQAATYTDEDEVGLGVTAYVRVKGEAEDREFKIDLREAQPRNSTLWATNPLQQLKYRAARGLGNSSMPGIFMGVPFDRDDIHTGMKDVTPNESLKEAFLNINSNETVAEADEIVVVTEPENKMGKILTRTKEFEKAKDVKEVTIELPFGMTEPTAAENKTTEITTSILAAKSHKEIEVIIKGNETHIAHMDTGLKNIILATKAEREKVLDGIVDGQDSRG